MEVVYYTVKQINGEYAILLSGQGIENTVAMALLPSETEEGIRLRWENFSYEVL